MNYLKLSWAVFCLLFLIMPLQAMEDESSFSRGDQVALENLRTRADFLGKRRSVSEPQLSTKDPEKLAGKLAKATTGTSEDRDILDFLVEIIRSETELVPDNGDVELGGVSRLSSDLTRFSLASEAELREDPSQREEVTRWMFKRLLHRQKWLTFWKFAASGAGIVAAAVTAISTIIVTYNSVTCGDGGGGGTPSNSTL